jgi:hypothetical protein
MIRPFDKWRGGLDFGGQVGQPLDTANTNIADWMARAGGRPCEGATARVLVHPKMATLIVDKLPKFTRVPTLTLLIELFCHCNRELMSIWRLSRNDPTAIQRRAWRHRRRKPPTNSRSHRGCIGCTQTLIVTQHLRYYSFCLAHINSKRCHFSLLADEATLFGAATRNQQWMTLC